jgi:hypothetical protein
MPPPSMASSGAWTAAKPGRQRTPIRLRLHHGGPIESFDGYRATATPLFAPLDLVVGHRSSNFVEPLRRIVYYVSLKPPANFDVNPPGGGGISKSNDGGQTWKII